MAIEKLKEFLFSTFLKAYTSDRHFETDQTPQQTRGNVNGSRLLMTIFKK
jgi:hypothetical protein